MTRLDLVGLAVAAASAATTSVGAAGCGDNAEPCGGGTIARAGVCVPIPGVTCGAGTRLDGDRCVIDPAACPAGTVVIANRCADPTAELTIDLEEGPEPNGMAISPGVEPSTAPAGAIALKPAGQTTVVHGHLAPFRDADGDGQLDPDVDTYVVTVTAPTLLDVGVDGVGGALGAFYVAGDPLTAPGYERYGVSITGDAVERRLLLPAAGRYAIAIADARSIAIGHNPPPAAGSGGATGGPDAGYYASLTVRPIPPPVEIALSGGTGSRTGTLSASDVAWFTAMLGTGASDVHVVMPGPAAASVAVIAAGRLAGYADETPGTPSQPPADAEVQVSGLGAGDLPAIAVDAVYNEGPAPEPFTLTVTFQ